MKRILDFLLAALGLLISSPFWLVFSLLIWLEDRGGVFYFQERVGKDGKIFMGMKFRSMKSAFGGETVIVQTEERDVRVTKIGRLLRATAMDELPQLINILKGDMSFVGPRALAPKEREVGQTQERSIYDIPGFKERALVRPGLTGVAQVFAPRDIKRQDKFKYDIWYIKNQDIFLDLYLIFLSFLVTFGGRWEVRCDKFRLLGGGLKSKIEKAVNG